MTLYNWLLEHFIPLFISVDKLDIYVPFINAPLIDIFSVIFVLTLSIIIVAVFLYAPYKIFMRLCKGPNRRRGK